MTTEVDLKLSRSLQDAARIVDAALSHVAGEKVLFSLMVWTDGRAQYVSNADRADVVKAMEEMLQRWRDGTPDIPEHLKQ